MVYLKICDDKIFTNGGKADLFYKYKKVVVILFLASFLLSGCTGENKIKNSTFNGVSEDVLAQNLLYMGVMDNNLEVCAEAIQYGADVNEFGNDLYIIDSQNKKEGNPLMGALCWQEYSIADLLINKGADINYQNYDGVSALMLSVGCGNKMLVEDLIKLGADVNLKDNKGKNALDYAITADSIHREEDRVNIVNILLKNNVNITNEQLSAILYNSESACLLTQTCLKWMNKNNITSRISPALNAAILGDNESLLKKLNNGEFESDELKNIARFTAAFGNTECFEKLKNADKRLLDNSDCVYIAAQYGNSEMVNYFINNKVDFDNYKLFIATAKSGKNALGNSEADCNSLPDDKLACVINTSAMYNNIEFISHLKDKGFNIDVGLYSGESSNLYGTPFEVACFYSNYELMNYLLDNGADINGGKEKGKALSYAVLHNDIKLLDFLISNNCDVNIITEYSDGSKEDPILWEAIRNGSLDIVKRLVSTGADTGTVQDSNAVYEASLYPSCNIFEYILKSSKADDINFQDEQGMTPLMNTVNLGYTKMVNIALDNGCDKSIKNRDGQIAFDIAERNKYTDIVKILK